jgi:hypothetical protein
MRATEYLFLVVMIGIFSVVIIMGANELNSIYPDNPIQSSDLEQYNDWQGVSESADATLENFKKLGDDSKWYQKIGAGIVAIPYAVISFPLMIVQAILILGRFMSDSLGFLPSGIILAMGALLIIEIVRRLLEFFNRARA